MYERKKKGTAINPLRAALACINEVRRLRIVKKVKRSVTRDEGSEEDMSDDKFCEDESSETEKDSESDNEDIMPHKVLTPGCYKSDSEDKKNKEGLEEHVRKVDHLINCSGCDEIFMSNISLSDHVKLKHSQNEDNAKVLQKQGKLLQSGEFDQGCGISSLQLLYECDWFEYDHKLYFHLEAL